MLKSSRARRKGQFKQALVLLDEAAAIIPLGASDRVHRADLLLSDQRVRDAHVAFAALREEFNGSEDKNHQYLRHYCTHQLSLLSRGSDQWAYEAKQAKLVDCSASLKGRFPMVTVDEIHEARAATLMSAMGRKRTLAGSLWKHATN